MIGKPSPHKVTPDPALIPSGLCECGCGEQTPIATHTDRNLRWYKGHPRPYVKGHHGRKRKGVPHPNPRPKPESIRENGYVFLYRPDHPNVPKDGYMLEHRLVWEETHGQLLGRHMHVHHVNGIRDDNCPENLIALTKHEHMRLHATDREPVSDETRRKLSESGHRAWEQRRQQQAE